MFSENIVLWKTQGYFIRQKLTNIKLISAHGIVYIYLYIVAYFCVLNCKTRSQKYIMISNPI